jgi:hypothetical protein
MKSNGLFSYVRSETTFRGVGEKITSAVQLVRVAKVLKSEPTVATHVGLITGREKC